MDLCWRVVGTNLQNVPKKCWRPEKFAIFNTHKIRTVNGAQTLMDLQQIDNDSWIVPAIKFLDGSTLQFGMGELCCSGCDKENIVL